MGLADDVERARLLVADAQEVVVLTGAGISTDSGISDFRGPGGLWTRNPGAEQRAQIGYYLSNPDHRKNIWRNRAASAAPRPEPNAGHRALVALERRGKLHTLVTQNIDGLHVAAGSDPTRVIEIHGTTRDVMCMSCDERAPMERALERVRAGEEDPPCRSCGGILKAATISFGQSLVYEDLARSELAARGCDLLLAVGSSLVVYPVAAFVPIAKRAGARLVILNAEPTEFDRIADVAIHGSISDVLPSIVGEPDAEHAG